MACHPHRLCPRLRRRPVPGQERGRRGACRGPWRPSQSPAGPRQLPAVARAPLRRRALGAMRRPGPAAPRPPIMRAAAPQAAVSPGHRSAAPPWLPWPISDACPWRSSTMQKVGALPCPHLHCRGRPCHHLQPPPEACSARQCTHRSPAWLPPCPPGCPAGRPRPCRASAPLAAPASRSFHRPAPGSAALRRRQLPPVAAAVAR